MSNIRNDIRKVHCKNCREAFARVLRELPDVDDDPAICNYRETRWPDGSVRKCLRPKGHNALANESDMRPHMFSQWEP